MIFSEISEFGAVQRIANLVDLEKCWKMRIWTQKSALIQPRTSSPKFAWSKQAIPTPGHKSGSANASDMFKSSVDIKYATTIVADLDIPAAQCT